MKVTANLCQLAEIPITVPLLSCFHRSSFHSCHWVHTLTCDSLTSARDARSMLSLLLDLSASVVAPAPKAIIAGGGIGGLCTALTLQEAGWECEVYEKTSQYKPFGGPIQIASNGLEALRQIDASLADDIVAKGNGIGDRINGLKDGISNEWFATFDLATPATARGQEPSLVIDRPVLQELLLDRVGGTVTKGVEVVGCESEGVGGRVSAKLATGETATGDLLVGSDGLNSKMRTVLNPAEAAPSWSGYTCFAAIAYTVPHDVSHRLKHTFSLSACAPC